MNRFLALLGILFFAGLATYSLKSYHRNKSARENDEEVSTVPIWVNILVSIVAIIVALLCLLYAVGQLNHLACIMDGMRHYSLF